MSKRVPGSMRTRQPLCDLIEGRLSLPDGRAIGCVHGGAATPGWPVRRRLPRRSCPPDRRAAPLPFGPPGAPRARAQDPRFQACFPEPRGWVATPFGPLAASWSVGGSASGRWRRTSYGESRTTTPEYPLPTETSGTDSRRVRDSPGPNHRPVCGRPREPSRTCAGMGSVQP